MEESEDCNLTESIQKKSEIDGGERYIPTE